MHPNLRFALRLVATNVNSVTAFRGAFFLQAGFMMVNNLIFFCVWLLFFRKFPEIRGWRLADVTALYGLVAASFGCAMLLGGGVRNLGEKIIDGDLDNYLAQPKPVLLYVVGSHSLASGWGDFVSGFGLILFSGYADLAHLPLIALLLAGSTILFLACAVLISSLPFWLGNFELLGRQLLEFLVTFSVYPQVIFSGYFKVVLFTLIPAGFIGFLPVEILRSFTWTELLAYLGGTVFYAGLAVYIFHSGLRRYESGNRIGLRS